MTMARPQKDPIYSHALPPSPLLLSVLHKYLPYSIPVLRRLQFPGGFPPTAVVLATFPEFSNQKDTTSHGTDDDNVVADLPLPFVIGYFDRAAKPGVQGFIFSSLELPASLTGDEITRLSSQRHEAGEAKGINHAEQEQLAVKQIISLFARLSEICPSDSTSYTKLGKNTFTQEEASAHDLAEHAARILLMSSGNVPDTIFLGSVNAKIEEVLLYHQCKPLRHDLHGSAQRYTKYLIDVDRVNQNYTEGKARAQDDLPSGMSFSPVREEDYEFVMRNNRLIRHPKNLLGMPSCGIRLAVQSSDDMMSENLETPSTDRQIERLVKRDEDDRLIAFAFLGQEGCVRTLHVESEFRNQKLGAKLVKQLLVTGNPLFESRTAAKSPYPPDKQQKGIEEGKIDWTKVEMAHVDIWHGNQASVRLFQKIGAVEAWKAVWPTIDLERTKGWFDMEWE